MNPHSLDFNKSPHSPQNKRRILGEIDNIYSIKTSLFKPNSPLDRLKSPLGDIRPLPISPLAYNSPVLSPKPSPKLTPRSLDVYNVAQNILDRPSPLTSKSVRNRRLKRVFEERTRFKMSNKENCGPPMAETFLKLDVEEETRDCSFGGFQSTRETEKWSNTKLDFSNLQSTLQTDIKESFVPEKEMEPIDDFETLHDLEEEFDADNFDTCTKYEIISTDSPNIISRGRPSTSRKVNSKDFMFGAPLAENEPSTSFNRPTTATRMLNFEEEDFEFTSPAIKKTLVKKSLKFNETPTKNPLRHEKSDSSIGSMNSISPASSKLRLYTSESTTSMESGFISELEEPFLEIEESISPKIANIDDLLSGQIKNNIIAEKRKGLNRSLSFNPECKARVSLFSIKESPQKRCSKRTEESGLEVATKRRKSSTQNPSIEKIQRPVLQRAFSENNASIMSALARSAAEPDLIGDFSLPFALPLTSGEHSDLKSISCETLAGLLRGEYEDSISEFQVIDCRYPYEYDGGHILGAVNLYTQDQVLDLVNKPLQPREDEAKRRILVFHCEFSRERGPKLSRFLRSSDREQNKENYPCLHYPEVYLLHEGYRSFYQKYPDLCSPAGYTAMLDPQHRHLLRKHRSVSQPTSTHIRRNRLLL
ncbi:M-phase inducer phosphatase isoform X2 [Manduca sexta]|nr:M-phase inducer phosphatase isoform X2 [Manduca sexta]